MNARTVAAGVVALIALGFVGATGQPASEIEIAAMQRVIQCDGFLMEWSEQQARPMGEGIVWDAVQTPDGVAGYVRATRQSRCRLAEVLVVREDEVDSIELAVPGTGAACCPFHAVQFDTAAGETVVEFQLTWNRLGSSASSGQYRLRLEALDSTAAQCAIARFSGPAGSFAAQVFTLALKRQIALVAAMLVLYGALMAWVRMRRTRRTQSLHQSA